MDARSCVLTLLSVLVVVSCEGLRCFSSLCCFSLFMDGKG